MFLRFHWLVFSSNASRFTYYFINLFLFLGFDAIATTGEEVMNPKRNIPLSIVLTLATVATCYCSVSLVLTLMIPYYIIDVAIPIPQAFDYVQMHWAAPVVTVGAMASLITW